MPVSLSIKNVPEDKVARLRERAAANHRSLQGELMAIVTAAVDTDGPGQRLSVRDILADNRQRGFTTGSDSVRMIREDRDDPDR